MKTVAEKLYEGMFLVDSALAASDWQGVNDTIRSILERFGADIRSMEKWDDRRLAYDIRGKSRGTYILAYFRIDGPRVTEIERAVKLTDSIMRVLILCVEGIDEKFLSRPKPKPSDESEDSDDSSVEDESDEDESDVSDDYDDADNGSDELGEEQSEQKEQ